MMSISQSNEKSFGLKSVIPFFTVVFLIILMVLPYKMPLVSDIMPYLTLIGVYYWSVFKPEFMPVSAVFVIGILQDILLGSPLGLTSFLLVVVQQFIFFQGRRFLERDFLFNWFVFVMIVIGFGTLTWIIVSLYFRVFLDYIGIIGQILLTIAFYPLITWFLGITKKMVS